MQEIEYTNLIITCEACGNVKRYMVRNQEECDRIFREFRCENNCGRNLSSFITLGTLKREPADSQNGVKKSSTSDENSSDSSDNEKS